MAQVVAVVLACARAESLGEVVAALRAQTRPPDRILLVDSAATPAVKDVLEREARQDDVDVLVLGRNAGSAGGFCAGLEAAAAVPETEWVVAFDDDAVPATDCLELLLDAALAVPEAGAIGATSRAPDGELAWALNIDGHREPAATVEALRTLAAGRGVVSVAELAWHGLLLPAPLIQELGGPRADLFMWYEDVEFGLRLRRAGRPLYVVPDASVTHPPPPRTVRVRIAGLTLDAPVTDRRRSYLMVRNSLVVRHAYCGARFWWADLPLTLIRAGAVTLSLPGPRWLAVRDVLLRGVLDAARGRLGPPTFEA